MRGTTEAINLVAQSLRPAAARGRRRDPDLRGSSTTRTSCRGSCSASRPARTLKVVPITARGEVDFDAFERCSRPRTRLVALAHVSNALGTIVPVERFIAAARERGVPVLLDGAQAVPHMRVDVQALDCDFYCFSAPQDVRPDRHRRAVRPRGAARSACRRGRAAAT